MNELSQTIKAKKRLKSKRVEDISPSKSTISDIIYKVYIREFFCKNIITSIIYNYII